MNRNDSPRTRQQHTVVAVSGRFLFIKIIQNFFFFCYCFSLRYAEADLFKWPYTFRHATNRGRDSTQIKRSYSSYIIIFNKMANFIWCVYTHIISPAVFIYKTIPLILSLTKQEHGKQMECHFSAHILANVFYTRVYDEKPFHAARIWWGNVTACVCAFVYA